MAGWSWVRLSDTTHQPQPAPPPLIIKKGGGLLFSYGKKMVFELKVEFVHAKQQLSLSNAAPLNENGHKGGGGLGAIHRPDRSRGEAPASGVQDRAIRSLPLNPPLSRALPHRTTALDSGVEGRCGRRISLIIVQLPGR